ncbi:MAG: Precorrin-3B methylase [Leptolyngbya sp. SIO1E4]|nr:Precorrin-3B methylase [Leptolyngbya sp. SIO1E4]
MSAFEKPLEGEALIKEVCRRIRVARSYWDAHNNAACRKERERALALYNTLSKPEKEKIPQVLRVWLRYRSEKYFGDHRTAPGSDRKTRKTAAKRSPRSKRSKRR